MDRVGHAVSARAPAPRGAGRGPQGRPRSTGGAVALAALVFGMLGFLAGCGDPIAVLGDTPGLMRLVAGVPNAPGRDVSPIATATELRYPGDVAMDLDGVLYVADTENARVLAVTSAGELRVVFDDYGCATDCVEEATDLAIDQAGRLVVADERGHRVWRFDPGTGARTLLAGDGVAVSGPDGGPAVSTSVHGPRGVAAGPDGRVYISEGRGHRVRLIRPDGTLTTVAGTGEASFGGDGGPAIEAGIDFPGGIDVSEGVLYLADAGNDRIRAVDLASGIITTFAGTGARSFGGDGGDPVAAAFNLPRDVGVSPDGRSLYVADTGNHRVRVITPGSNLIGTFAGSGDTEFNGNLLDAGATSLHGPRGVATSPFGLVLIADTEHHVVWRTPLGL